MQHVYLYGIFKGQRVHNVVRKKGPGQYGLFVFPKGKDKPTPIRQVDLIEVLNFFNQHNYQIDRWIVKPADVTSSNIDRKVLLEADRLRRKD